MNNQHQPLLQFHNVKSQISKLIKVIGVGGAGTNAVNYMFEKDPLSQVEYIVCNTDIQALKASPVPRKIQIGKSVTKGLGAGSNPEIGQKAVLEDLDDIRRILSENTKMVFITAGLGGGTGTGAAPEIAKIASELGLLTVAVVTMPFEYEGERRLKQAQEGLKKLKPLVDSLIIINNEKIIEVYGDLGWKKAFAKSDEVLSNAVRSVTKVITDNYEINVDFNDVEAVLKKSGTALISTAEAGGPNRAEEVVEKVLDSPLLNDNHIIGAKDLLLLILSGSDEITVNEISRINKALKKATDNPKLNIIQGLGEDPSLGDKISITIIATGFKEKGAISTSDEEKDFIFVSPPDSPVVLEFESDQTEVEPVEGEEAEDTADWNEPAGEEEISPADDDFKKEWLLFEKEKDQAAKVISPLNGQEENSRPEPAQKPIFERLDEKQMPHQPSLFDQVEEQIAGESGKDHSTGRAEDIDGATQENKSAERTDEEHPSAPDSPADTDTELNENGGPQDENDHAEEEKLIIVDEKLELSGEEAMLVSRHPGSDIRQQEPAQASFPPPAKPTHMVTGPLKRREKERLRQYMHRFSKTFDGPVIPDNPAPSHHLDLSGKNPRWNDENSYINPKLD